MPQSVAFVFVYVLMYMCMCLALYKQKAISAALLAAPNLCKSKYFMTCIHT